MPKENPYTDKLKRQDDKLKLALATRFVLGSKAFSSRPIPSLLFLSTAVVIGEALVRYDISQEYQRQVKAGDEDSYVGPLSMPDSKDVMQAAQDILDDGKQVYGFFKRVSAHVDHSETLKRFYPKTEANKESEHKSWWRPW